MEGGGNPISKDRLIESAWPGLAIEESNLTVQIAALRRVFAEEPGGDSWIETLPRRGYRYVGPVAVKEQENQGAAGNEQPALAPPDKPSLAVMPFTWAAWAVNSACAMCSKAACVKRESVCGSQAN